jgi:hypothetical protein
MNLLDLAPQNLFEGVVFLALLSALTLAAWAVCRHLRKLGFGPQLDRIADAMDNGKRAVERFTTPAALRAMHSLHTMPGVGSKSAQAQAANLQAAYQAERAAQDEAAADQERRERYM